MASDMPEPFVDAQIRFFSQGEFDDSSVVDTVRTLTGGVPAPSSSGLRRMPPRSGTGL
jgi:hypothetical protein